MIYLFGGIFLSEIDRMGYVFGILNCRQSVVVVRAIMLNCCNVHIWRVLVICDFFCLAAEF